MAQRPKTRHLYSFPVSTRVTKKTKVKIEELAIKHRRTPSQVVRMLLEKALEQEPAL